MLRKTVLLLAAALVAAVPAGAVATPPSPPSPIEIGNGGCDSGYTGVVNVGATYVCRRDLQPDVKILNTHCSAGYTEVGSEEIDRWVCVRV